MGEVFDSSSQTRTKTFYVRDPRLRGARVKSTERRTFDGRLLQLAEYEPVFVNQGNGVYFSYYKTTTERSYELNGVETGRKKTEQSFDAFGNAVEIKITYKNGYQVITTNEYSNDAANWKLGRLLSATVTKSKTGKPTITKNSSFSYDSDGYLVQEVLLPSHPTLRIQTDYTLNAYGNTTATTISGPGIVSRTDKTTYDSENRFPASAANALGHTSTFQYENGYLKTSTDPNQLSVSYERDVMGRETKVTYPDGTFKTTAYKFCDGSSNCPPGAIHYIQEEMAGKGISRAYIDSLDRVKRTEKQGFDGRKIWVDYLYNKLGQKTGESDEYYEGDTPQWHTIEFDMLQRSVRQTAPGNRTATTEYATITYRGEVLSMTKSVNFEQQNEWEAEDELGKKIFTLNHLGDTLRFEYDNDFNVIATQDPKGNRITATYNIRGFKTAMSDPDMGTYTYDYNALGLVTRQTNPDNQVATLEYNPLNELVKRNEPEGVSTWEYHTGNKAIGELSKVFLNSQLLENHAFDALGRPAGTTYYREGESYTYSYAYHPTLGHLEEETYPGNNLTVKYLFNAYGYLTEVKNKTTNASYWKANALDANDRVTSEQLGNGLLTQHTYNAATGFLERIRTGTSTQTEKYQDYRYTYSTLGNLTSRKEYFDGQIGNRSEVFEYDKLNRLTKTTGPLTVSQTYDALGNITYKSDVGYYRYGENNTGPHVLTSIDHKDINVNSTLGACTYPFNQGIQLTSYNYVSLLANQQGDSLKFSYGAGRERIIQTVIKGGKLKWKKHYAGGKFEKLRYSAQYYDEVYFIQAGGAVIAFVERSQRRQTGLTTKTHYIHSDHLGSMSVLTDQNGNVERRMSHDPWGRAREATTWQPYAAPPELAASQRGFTFHEMLDMDWLICMNARIYDPISGRFLTPDPIIQFPDDLQSYNRYAYTGNNPLSFVDPSGHSFLGGVKKLFKKVIGTVVGLAVAFYMPYLLPAIAGLGILGSAITVGITGIASGFAGSFVGALVNGAGFGGAIQSGMQGGVWGGINALATFGVGQLFYASASLKSIPLLKAATHGVVQGAISEAQGGAFSNGFWSGLGGTIAAGFMPHQNGDPTFLETVIAGTIGGTVSDLTGGDFANGAVSAAFIYLYNDNKGKNSKAVKKDMPFEANNGQVESADGILFIGVAVATFAFAYESLAALSAAAFTGLGRAAGFLRPGSRVDANRLHHIFGQSYKAVSEVTVPIKNTGLIKSLNATSKGDWVKVYEAGIQNGNRIETHYFRNNTTGQVFDVKTKYNYWHQKAFRNID
jgi:RHS repeat-associated protein